MRKGVYFRSYQESDGPVLPGLFIRAIQTVYPELQDGGWTSALNDVKRNYIDTGGAFLVGVDNEIVVAMGGLKRLNDTTGEMVRVAVEPGRQDAGLGQAFLDAIEARAKDLGITKIILDTTAKQEAARHLYEKNGYILVDRRLVDHPTGKSFDTFFYEKELV